MKKSCVGGGNYCKNSESYPQASHSEDKEKVFDETHVNTVEMAKAAEAAGAAAIAGAAWEDKGAVLFRGEGRLGYHRK